MNRSAVVSYISTVIGHPFQWGSLDCTLFPALCLDVLLGNNEAQAHVGKWDGLKSAIQYSAENELTLEGWLRARGCDDIPDGYVQVGDFLLITTLPIQGQMWVSAGVVVGGRVAVCTADGVQLFARSDIQSDVAAIGVRQCRQ